MQGYDEYESFTGEYSCYGTISDMRILVQLEEIVPVLGLKIEEHQHMQENRLNESRTFCWQERVLSRKERKDEEPDVPSVMFTYTSSDMKEIMELQKNRFDKTLCHSKPHKLTKRRLMLTPLPTKNIMTYTGHDKYLPVQESEVMCILVDLNELFEFDENDSNDSSEYILVKLIYDKELEKLKVYPDLNGDKSTGNPGHSIKSTGAARSQYVYWISILQDFTSDLYLVYQPMICKSLPKFEILEDENIELNLNGCIISCQGFKSNFQIVSYSFYLPEGWTSTSKSLLSGNTQRSINKSGISTFQHLIDVQFSLSLPPNSQCSSRGTCRSTFEEFEMSWPQLFLKVLSTNYCGHISVDGYSSLVVPSKSGQHKYNLISYGPKLTNGDLLRKFFIGSLPQDSKCGKYGIEAYRSGEISIELNVIHQFQAMYDESVTYSDEDSTSNVASSISSALGFCNSAPRKPHSV